MKPGDRVGVAVSGGADSVALLRLLLQARAELGVALAVVHFNHKIRGIHADSDQRFVAELAARHELQFFCDSAETTHYARERGLSLEAAGRALRYGYFSRLLEPALAAEAANVVPRALDVIATAHTMDDQAETVLLRVLRGAGTRGLAGIFPKRPIASGQSPAVVRPLLQVRRTELREYLQTLGQEWHEDASNLDVKHTRNRLRRELLPLIEQEFNPSVVRVLAELAEVARGEEEYWHHETKRADMERGADTARLPAGKSLLQKPLAIQRRLIRALAERAGLRLEYQHVERILATIRSVQPNESKEVELPSGWVATCTGRELRLDQRVQREQAQPDYQYLLKVPGEVAIPELDKLLKAFRVPVGPGSSGYNQRHLLASDRLPSVLVVRNWRPGDRFWLAHSKAPKKLKELLLRQRIAQPQRAQWPVVASGDRVVWVPGLGTSAEFLPASADTTAVVIEEVNSNRCGEAHNFRMG